MSTLAERWTAAAEAAVELSTPAEIVEAIRTADAPDNGLRAATFEARILNGHLGDSHPERMALDDRQQRHINVWWKTADEASVRGNALRFIDSIDAINALRDGGTAWQPGTRRGEAWTNATTTATQLARRHGGKFIPTAIDTTTDLDAFHATIRAVEQLTTLALRWGCPHVATIQERLQHPDVCLSHARIGEERPVCGSLVLCKMCRDLIDEWGDPKAEHRLSESWPTNEMLAAQALGHQVEYRKLRSDYLASHGVRRAG